MNADPAWYGQAWLLFAAYTLGLACVALLRRPCRRAFGAELACMLWLLPLLAMLASVLPHGRAADIVRLSGNAWIAVAEAIAEPRALVRGGDWQAAVPWVWLVGTAASLLRAAVAQARYSHGLRGAMPLHASAVALPVLRAPSAAIGPVLVGAIRPRIVVPMDFEARYTEEERVLVLAHEVMHARRRDGLWSLVAQLLASLFWFHPLTWWALGALRHDQELACDAAVLRAHPGCWRRYADALLKVSAEVPALPVGCSWSSPHPLRERIAMLNVSSPSIARSRAGLSAGLSLALCLSGVVYAASAPPPSAGSTATAGEEYQLDIELALASGTTMDSHAQHLQLALCEGPGERSAVASHGIEMAAITRPLAGGRVHVDVEMRTAPSGEPVYSRLEGELGRALRHTGTLADEGGEYTLALTPRRGCPARAAEATARVTLKIQGTAARQAARLIATQAGLTLVNPDALDERAVALQLDSVPAGTALQLVAGIDGMRAELSGGQVRFIPKH